MSCKGFGGYGRAASTKYISACLRQRERYKAWVGEILQVHSLDDKTPDEFYFDTCLQSKKRRSY
jgi:hypothetical protein